MKTHGFTLIELSIVLVIIGLLAGGILVGNDLIKAAEIRGTISQMEKFNTAAQTFKLKYNYLPGDIPVNEAGAFGFFQLNTCPRCGNGIIDAPTESYIFWQHLSEAKLIEGAYGQNPNNPLRPEDGLPTSTPAGYEKLFLPEAKIPNIFFYVWPTWRFSTTDGSPFDLRNNDYGIHDITPIVAYTIDGKIDDGKPNTGKIINYTQPNWIDSDGNPIAALWSNDASAGYCTYGGTQSYTADVLYNTTPAGESQKVCEVFIKTGF